MAKEKQKIKVVISDFDLTLVDITPIETTFKSRDKEERKQMEKVAKTLPLVSGWETVLETLRNKNIPFLILSNNQKNFLDKMNKWKKINAFHIIGRYGTKATYPYTESKVPTKSVKLEQAFEILQETYPDLQRNEILYIGDQLRDIEETKIFGGVSGGCMWCSREKADLLNSNADYIFERPTDLLKLVG